MFGSRLRDIVVFQLAKAYRLGVDVSVARLVQVFNFNSGLVYRFVRELEGEGLVERVSRGRYRLRGSERVEKLVDYVLSGIGGSEFYPYFPEVVPETQYYIVDLPSQEWFRAREYTLVVVDERLKGRIRPPPYYKVVYTPMRGRRWRYDWDLRASVGAVEQSLADLLSYDPDYPVEQYIYLNMDRIDLDEVAKKATAEGLKRLATFLAFLSAVLGKPIPSAISYNTLLDEDVLRERYSEYITWVFTNGLHQRSRCQKEHLRQFFDKVLEKQRVVG